MLPAIGIVLLGLAIQAAQESPRIEGVGEWDIIVRIDPITRSKVLALRSSDALVQLTNRAEPALITTPRHTCFGRALLIRVDENKGILLGEQGRRNVELAAKQMLTGKKATLAYYDVPCGSFQTIELDLTGFAQTLAVAAKLPRKEIERLEALVVAEEQRVQQKQVEEERRRHPSSALLGAARDGDIVQLIAALNSGADVNAMTESNGYTALIWASARGHLEAVRMLLEAGADKNQGAGDGQTALMRATDYGHADIVKLLLSSGADVNVQTDQGLTALKLAALKGHRDIVQLLEKAGARE